MSDHLFDWGPALGFNSDVGGPDRIEQYASVTADGAADGGFGLPGGAPAVEDLGLEQLELELLAGAPRLGAHDSGMAPERTWDAGFLIDHEEFLISRLGFELQLEPTQDLVAMTKIRAVLSRFS